MDRVGQPDPQTSSTSKTTTLAPPAGVLTRVTERLLPMAAGIWHN